METYFIGRKPVIRRNYRRPDRVKRDNNSLVIAFGVFCFAIGISLGIYLATAYSTEVFVELIKQI